MLRDPYPRRDEAAEPALIVCRFSIRLLSSVSKEERKEIARLASFHDRGRTPHFLKHGRLELLILHLVHLKDNSAFKLSPLVSQRQFTILFLTDLEDTTDMDRLL